MNPQFIKSSLNLLVAVFSLIAAFLWWKASTVAVRPTDSVLDGWIGSQVTYKDDKVGHIDPIKTGLKQAEINKYAAMSASLAALFQAAALIF